MLTSFTIIDIKVTPMAPTRRMLGAVNPRKSTTVDTINVAPALINSSPGIAISDAFGPELVAPSFFNFALSAKSKKILPS